MNFKSIVWFCLFFFCATALAFFGHTDQAYISIIYPPLSIRVSFAWGVVFLILIFFVFYVFLRMITKFFNIPNYIADFIQRSRHKKVLQKICQTLNLIAAGSFVEANKSAEQAIKYSMSIAGSSKVRKKSNFYSKLQLQDQCLIQDICGAANLLGAVSAHFSKKYRQRDERLGKISFDSWQQARFLMEAKLSLKSNEIDIADTALRQYRLSGGDSYLADQFALKVAYSRCNWSAMRDKAILSERNEPQCVESGLSEARLIADKNLLFDKKDDPEALLAIWNNFDDCEKQTVSLAAQCMIFLIEKQHYVDVLEIAESILCINFSKKIVQLYNIAAINHDVHRAVVYLEKWQSKWPEDAEIFYALGCLCTKQKIWGKTQVFLEKALLIVEFDSHLKARIHFALAKMYEQLGEMELVNKHLRLGSKLIEVSLPVMDSL